MLRPQVVRLKRSRIDVKIARRFVSPLALLFLWQLGSATHLIPATKLAAPMTILSTAWSLIASGALLHHLLVSLTRVIVGRSSVSRSGPL